MYKWFSCSFYQSAIADDGVGKNFRYSNLPFWKNNFVSRFLQPIERGDCYYDIKTNVDKKL